MQLRNLYVVRIAGAIAVLSAASAGNAHPAPAPAPAPEPTPSAKASEFKFADQHVRALFDRAIALEKGRAKESWHDEFASFRYNLGLRYYVQIPDLPLRTIIRKRPAQLFGLSVEAGNRDKPLEVYSFGITGESRPAAAWGCQISYEASGGASDSPNGSAATAPKKLRPLFEMFTLRFFHKDFNEKDPGQEDHAIDLANSCYSDFFEAGDGVRYGIQVSCFGTRSWEGDHSQPREPQIRRLFASSDSFREESLEELDHLEKFCQKQIMSGDAIYEKWLTNGGGGRFPPMPAPFNKSELTDSQKKEMLKSAEDESNRRRRLINAHYAEMHAAMVAAFPLDKIFGEQAKHPDAPATAK